MSKAAEPATLCQWAIAVLNTPDAGRKARLTRQAWHLWQQGDLPLGHADEGSVPAHPARPPRPQLLAPGQMPRRRGNSPGAVAAMVHAVLHIELNAIDLAWDIIARFATVMPRAFSDDWARIAAEEGKHFNLLNKCIDDLGYQYGDFPAHDGLWEAAAETTADPAARLAIVPMVLEARGLDVTPQIIARMRARGHEDIAAALEVIFEEEIGHVAAGCRWFAYLCAERRLDPCAHFHNLVRRHFKGRLKPPFNDMARERAGLLRDFYVPLSHVKNAAAQ